MIIKFKILLFSTYSFFRYFSFRQAFSINFLSFKSTNLNYFSFNTNCADLSIENTLKLNTSLHSKDNVIIPQTQFLFQTYSECKHETLRNIFSPNKLNILYADYLIFYRFYFFHYLWNTIFDRSASKFAVLPFSKNHLRVFIYIHILSQFLEPSSCSTLFLYFENHPNERSLSFVFSHCGIKVIGLLPYYFCLATSSSIVPSVYDIVKSYSPDTFYTLGHHSTYRLSNLFPNGIKISASIIGRSVPLKKLQAIPCLYPLDPSFIILLPYHLELSKKLLRLISFLSLGIHFPVLIKIHPSHKFSYFKEFRNTNFSFERSKSLFDIMDQARFSHCLSLITSAPLELLPLPIHILYYLPDRNPNYLPFDCDQEILDHVMLFHDVSSLFDLLKFTSSSNCSNFNLLARSYLFLNFYNQPIS